MKQNLYFEHASVELLLNGILNGAARSLIDLLMVARCCEWLDLHFARVHSVSITLAISRAIKLPRDAGLRVSFFSCCLTLPSNTLYPSINLFPDTVGLVIRLCA